MAGELDFPPTPIVGQKYTGPSGAVYEWDGYAWTIGYYDSNTQAFDTVGALLQQIRTLLQDTDTSSGEYRYSTDSLITDINQGMLEMFRMRPDIFLDNKFKVPKFTSAQLDAALVIEPQFVPSLVYYTVGMAQLRDDEVTQDQRAGMFLSKFSSMTLMAA
jgi:hypothetical protein